MKIKKLCLIIFLAIVAMLNSQIIANESNTTDTVRSILEIISKMNLNLDSSPLNESITRKNNSYYNYKKIAIHKLDEDFLDCLVYYEADLLSGINKRESFDLIQNCFDKNIDRIEYFQFKWDKIDDTDEKLKCDKEIIYMSPTITGGIDRDPNSKKYFDQTGQTDPICIPAYLDSPLENMRSPFDGFVKIAKLFESIGFYRRAIDSYVEAYYIQRYKCFDHEIERYDLWIKVGELEAEEGQKVLAYRAFLKAVYNDPEKKIIDKATKYIVDLMRGNKFKEHDIKIPIYNVEKIKTIVEIYRKMCLHPLGLALLLELEEVKGVSFKEKEKIMRAEWQKIIDNYSGRYGQNLMILGNYRNDVKDWADAPILRPSDTFWKPVKNNINLSPKD